MHVCVVQAVGPELSFAYLNLPFCLPEPSWQLLGISSGTA